MCFLLSVTYIGKCFLAILKYADVGLFPSMGSEMDFQRRFLVEPFATASLRAGKGPFIRVDAIVSAEVRPTNKFLIPRCQKNRKTVKSNLYLSATFPWTGEATHLA
jgi:hypothetical protein